MPRGQLVRRQQGQVRRVARFAPYARTALAVGRRAYQVYKGYNKYRGQRTSRESENADGAPANATSTDKKFAVAYRKKRTTRKIRRQIRQVKNFKRTWSKVQGQKTLTLTNKQVFSPLLNQQVIDGVVGLYGLSADPGSDYGFSDIFKIKELVLGSTSPAQKQRFQINQVVLDIYLKNVSNNLAFVDLYEYVLRKDLESNLGDNIFQVFENLYNASVRVVGTQEFLTNLGWNPFEVTEICKRFLILKVHRLQIPAGANMSFHRVFKHVYTPAVEDLATGYQTFIGRKGHFRGFFARVAGDQSVVNQAEPCSVSFLTRRTYKYSTLYDSYNDQGLANPLVPT